ncbi:MAG: hypothetical protein HYY18_13090 [Planctomycetes bacterium]|nr:hypothetical protein [Planctomycetota bacterium]
MDSPRRVPWRLLVPAIVAVVVVGVLGIAGARRFMKDDPSPAPGASTETAPDAPCPLAADKPEIWPQRPFAKPAYRREECASRRLEPSAEAQVVSDGDRLSVIVPGGC